MLPIFVICDKLLIKVTYHVYVSDFEKSQRAYRYSQTIQEPGEIYVYHNFRLEYMHLVEI